MTTRTRAKLATAAAVTAGALTIATGLAVAGVLPDQASDTARDHAEVEAVTTTTATSTTTTTVADDDDVKSADVEKNEVENDAVEHPDNHGADVSAAAHDDAFTGREHGEHVSAVARDNAGQDDHAADGQATAEEHKSAEHGESGAEHPADD